MSTTKLTDQVGQAARDVINAGLTAIDALQPQLAAAQQSITSVQGALGAEVSARGIAVAGEAESRSDGDTAEGQARQSGIDAANVARVAGDQAEAAARQAADAEEAQARVAGDQAEAAARQAADAEEAQARVAGDQAEAAARQAADAEEAQARVAGDQARADADAALAVTLGTLGDQLRAAISAETNARTNGDDAERQARIAAIDTLTGGLAAAIAAIATKADDEDLTRAVTEIQNAATALRAVFQADVDTLTCGLADAVATVAAQRLDFVPPNGRPGDAPLRYTFVSAAAALAGPRAALPLLPPIMLRNGDNGPVARVSGPGILAARTLMVVEPGRLYRGRAVVQRRANPADPSGDTVRPGLVYLDQSLRVLGDVVAWRDYSALLTVDGRQECQALFSRTPGQSGAFTAPGSARFAVAVVQFFGADHLTDVEVLDADDVTDAFVLPAPTAELAAQVSALAAGDILARLAALEVAAGTAGAPKFGSKGEARFGTIPDSAQVVELLGRQFAGDGGDGIYVRTANALPADADTFTAKGGAVFVRVQPASDVAAGGLRAGFAAWMADLPTAPPDGSGQAFRDGDFPTVTP